MAQIIGSSNHRQEAAIKATAILDSATERAEKAVRKAFAGRPRSVVEKAAGTVFAVLAAPDQIDGTRGQLVELLKFEVLAPRGIDRRRVGQLLGVLAAVDQVVENRKLDAGRDVEIARLEKLAGSIVGDRAAADGYRQLAASLKEARPVAADVTKLRKAAGAHRRMSTSMSSGPDRFGHLQAADDADRDADRIERTLAKAGVAVTASDTAAGLFAELSRQSESIHDQIDEIAKSAGNEPPPRAVASIGKSEAAASAWVELSKSFADLAPRVQTLKQMPLHNGPQRMRRDGPAASPEPTADQVKAADYRRQAGIVSDPALRKGYEQLAANLEKNAKKGNRP